MKKKQSSWIPAGLCTIATAIATIYALLEYHNSVLVIGIASLLLLLSAFWLFTCISRLMKKEPEISVGQEQRERMNYEGMKLQGEEMIRLMNTFGKGTYAYSKRSAENLQAILEFTIQAQTTNERLLNDIIQNQTKTAKFQVKYAQEDTAKLIQTFTEQCRQLNDNLILCADKIENQELQVSPQQPDTNISSSLNELSSELVQINTSIQTLQLQLTTILQSSAPYTQTQPAATQSISEPVSPVAADAEAVVEGNQPSVEEIPDLTSSLSEELFMEESIPDIDEASISEEPILIEEADTAPSSNEDEFMAAEDNDSEDVMKALEELDAITESEEVPAFQEAAMSEAPVITPPSDNPNKQLSADEIAALFASL